jgi:hypothetical protein
MLIATGCKAAAGDVSRSRAIRPIPVGVSPADDRVRTHWKLDPKMEAYENMQMTNAAEHCRPLAHGSWIGSIDDVASASGGMHKPTCRGGL